MSKCNICPRGCGADRASGDLGVCNAPEELFVAKAMLHTWEEPCISGEGGAGTVFFAGCNLHCVYCQNKDISGGACGSHMTSEELEAAIFDLASRGAECIELVTPTHYTVTLSRLLRRIKPRLDIPVVWNCGGYESVEALRLLEGLVDVYMPDFKYFDASVAEAYSSAPDYFERASRALGEMIRQVGMPRLDGKGRMVGGVLVRHLVLPGHRDDSCEILKHVASGYGADSVLLSLMSQYTPDFYIESGCPGGYKNLSRRVTSFEYDSVMRLALELGFDGYFQRISSADRKYTPEFNR